MCKGRAVVGPVWLRWAARCHADGVIGGSSDSPTTYDALVDADSMDLLDIVDVILGWEQPEGDEWIGIGGDFEGRLARILDAAGSAYRVDDAGTGLEERVVPTVPDAVSQTIADASTAPDAGSAAEHLSLSWQAAYGLHPDPVRAYSEAIKAVESAAHAVVEPNNSKATLGTMLRVIRDAAPKFTTTLGAGSTAPAEAMMRALWEGQTSRHGGQGGAGSGPFSAESAHRPIALASVPRAQVRGLTTAGSAEGSGGCAAGQDPSWPCRWWTSWGYPRAVG
ncbi:hypothetical protein QFZ76_009957 [Streptomyces sp. V4I2]|nr:hypothetical protein [Streptomyces sp. V4I2]